MAKTTTKKTTRPPKSSKKTKSNIFSKINWGSKKIQLLLIVLVFGGIGGGYMVYKSRAASVVNSVASTSLTKNRARTFSLKEQKASTGKRNNMVALVQPRGSIAWSPGAHTLTTVNYRVCTTLRHEGKSTNARIWVGRYGTFSALRNDVRGVLSSDKYMTVCSGSFRGTGGRVSVTISNTANNNFRSGIITLQRL